MYNEEIIKKYNLDKIGIDYNRIYDFVGNNKIDYDFKNIVCNILAYGSKDINPRPKYADGTPAHTYSINHYMCRYNLSAGEFPALTLRPAAFKSAIKELLWIYQDQSNELSVLRYKYNVHWWDQWALEDDTIGQCYGWTVRKHDLMNNLLNGIKNDPDGRRHIISLWQEDDFKGPHALKPCCYMTIWNVRHETDGDYLDMCMIQRSCDYLVAGSTSNQVQYAAFLAIVAHCLGYKPGVYTWFVDNLQIYDRHIEAAVEMLNRDPIPCTPRVVINPLKTNFYDLTVDDIKLEGYPLDEVKQKNPQLSFDLGI